MIKLSRSDYERLLAYAKSELPNEACGLLAGTVENNYKIIKEIYLLTNIDHSDTHFTIDVAEQLSAIKDMRAKGLSLLGNWHSHPDSPPIPSDEDKRLAYDDKASYMILSLMDRGEPVLQAFKICGDIAEKEELILYN